MTICAVIMAGGSGTRLWPLSRAAHPKQFLVMHGNDTMLQATAKRLAGFNISSSVTICSEEHRFFVGEQLREIGQAGTIILEPMGRNTAPAIALAALIAKDDPLLLVLPADHVIEDEATFAKVVSDAIPLAETGKLVTFGVVPKETLTGYGYIRRGAKQGVGFHVEAFVEKPSVEAAQGYVNSAEYFWNSGMFLFRASRYLEELSKFRPDIYKACRAAIGETKVDMDFLRINREIFEACPSESIDYAVMENTKDAVVVPLDIGWSDIGSWSSLWGITEKDQNGNVTHGDVLLHKSKNSYVRTDGKLVAAIGVDDLVIVSTKDVLMVANKQNIQDVKVIAQQLRSADRPEWQVHQEVFRPWGKYEIIDAGERYQVKRLTVKPGAKLSIQMHHHRAEHWVIVTGTAKITNGEKTFLLSENESTYIPIGATHALENPGKVDLELIETQTGTYLGEDDIIRLSDRYGRT